MKHPVAVPILFVRTVARSQKRPEMFGSFPNIQGSMVWASGTTAQSASSGGALSIFQQGGNFCQIGNSGPGDLRINFDASSGNAFYGGSTVQPKAITVLPCIRF